MMIAIPDVEWQFINTLAFSTFAQLLKHLAAQVDLERFVKSPRGEKKPQPQRKKEPNRPHVSTSRLLAEKQRLRQLSRTNQQPIDTVKTLTSQALRS